jgi:putative membrane protein
MRFFCMKRLLFTRGFGLFIASAGMIVAIALLPAWAREYPSSTREPTTSSFSGSVSNADRSFINQAAQGGMAEVRLAELGEQKAASDNVKALASTLKEDHQKANDALADLAKSKGVELPLSISSTHPGIGDLENKQGQNFDEQFVMIAIKDQKDTIELFEQASRDMTDADLRAFTQRTLPVLRSHLQQAERAFKSMNKESWMER